MMTDQLQTTIGRVGEPAYWTETVLDFDGHPMPLVVGTDEYHTLIGVRFGPAADNAAWIAGSDRDDEALAPVVKQLHRYATGEITAFELPIRLTGSDFQVAVWTALLDIPYGTTTSYGRVAAAVGRGPSASRAVGSAVGSNPIPIIVPCHRVLHSTGGLGGYTGGLDRKRLLLAIESGQQTL